METWGQRGPRKTNPLAFYPSQELQVPTRALIIAIEDYRSSQSLYGTLEGTNAAARQFRDWVIQHKGVAPGDVLLCGGDALADVRTAGTEREAILKQVRHLRDVGKDQTEALYVFFSGHGFSFTDLAGRAPMDVLVASDFETPEDSGGACIQLQELQEKLRFALGPGDHYFFVDACRNLLPADRIDVPSLGVVLGRSQLGQPTSYTLYSTSSGATGDVRSGFSQALTDGLSGRGRAKSWQRGKLWVTFELLCGYVKRRVTQQDVDSEKKGPGDGLITELDPPPLSRCEVRVEGAGPDDHFTLEVRNALGPGGAPVSQAAFSGESYSFDLPPFDYFLTVYHPTAVVEAVEPPRDQAADLFDPAVVRFRKTPATTRPESTDGAAGPPPRVPNGLGLEKSADGPGTAGELDSTGPGEMHGAPGSEELEALEGLEHRAPAPGEALDGSASLYPQPPKPTGAPEVQPGGAAGLYGLDGSALEPVPVTFKSAPGVTLALTDLLTGASELVTGSASALLRPGQWRLKAVDHGVTLSTQTIEVLAGSAVMVDISPPPLTATHAAILDRVAMQDPSSGAAWFSESLGPTANRDLGLWLSLLGGSRIVGAPLEFSKLRDVPLDSFEDAAPGDSPLYVVAAFTGRARAVSFALDGAVAPAWSPLRPAQGLEMVLHARVSPAPGVHLLSLQVAGRAPKTWVVLCHPDRATLVVLSEGEGGLALLQYVLPLYSAKGRLDPMVLGPFAQEQPLRVIRTLYAIQTQFARRRNVAARLQDDPDGLEVWSSLESVAWVDPVASCIAGHEAARMGGSPLLVMNALRAAFPGLADAEALAVMAGREHGPVRQVPLLLDSVMALQEEDGHAFALPLPEHRLDFGGPWTSWSAAVPPDSALATSPAVARESGSSN